jgi:hypothetical protein
LGVSLEAIPDVMLNDSIPEFLLCDMAEWRVTDVVCNSRRFSHIGVETANRAYVIGSLTLEKLLGEAPRYSGNTQ